MFYQVEKTNLTSKEIHSKIVISWLKMFIFPLNFRYTLQRQEKQNQESFSKNCLRFSTYLACRFKNLF